MQNSNKLLKWFFWFWVKKYRISFLVIFLIIVAGIFSLLTIPKESSPDIKFGIITITTPYPWVNPNDIDSLITDKIEKEIKNIKWIKKITSTSSVWLSSTVVELHNNANTRNILTDIKDKIDKISLPENAKDTKVFEISSNNELMFEVLLYWDEKKFSYFDLLQKSQIIKDNLEWTNGIASISLWWTNMKWFESSSQINDYQIKILLDKNKIDVLDLDLKQIANIIKNYNKNIPIWNFVIWDLHYDFRFEGELKNIEELKKIVIRQKKWSNILLSDIATIKKEYREEKIQKLWFFNNPGFNYSSLVFNKSEWINVFAVSSKSKKALEKLIKENPDFEWLNVEYTKDMSQLIIDDYSNLSSTAIQTIILVFITIFIFVWLRESLIASMLLPLSFLITFIILDVLWFSLNFLTNFSLVLTLWIAIDTVIVIIEWASENIKLGYNKKSSILLSIRDYKAPLIAWTLTTLVAFLPLMFLPWVLWKFLAYIPITIFSTLLAALVLSLTLGSALFVKFAKNSNFYHIDQKLESTFSEEQAFYLAKERDWKTMIRDSKSSLRNKVLMFFSLWYLNILKKIIISRKNRLFIIFLPIILLIFTFVFISPRLGFTLFPINDQSIITWVIESKKWTSEEVIKKYLKVIDNVIYKIPEIKIYYSSISWNKINIYADLLDKKVRKKSKMRSTFDIEKEISNNLKKLEQKWFVVSIQTLKDGPPTWKAVWIKLITDDAKNIDKLKEISLEFREYLKNIKGVKNVSTSSSESPWQFVFRLNKDKLSEASLSPDDIFNSVYFYINWLKAWSIKSRYEDNDLVLKIEDFDKNLSPDDINNIVITTNNCVKWKCQKARIWDFAKFEFTKAVSSINREKWKISITVESDLLPWFLSSDIQPLFLDYAKDYLYPKWISYSVWWENEENKDLIISTFKSLFIALFLIFSILVFQFNSYSQPIIILYSVILALFWVNIWLFLTWNPYSVSFMIWFIALVWIVVNDAIILIDRINKNLEKWIDNFYSVISAWKSRLQPIIVTTLTTIFWILPLATQDAFWAWLSYTIVFGLFTGSSMTLFVIPSLYYEVFLRKKWK